ncbi:hypothetical protein ACFX12_044328 [Malus domestica]
MQTESVYSQNSFTSSTDCNAGTSNRHSVSSVICPPFTAVELIRKIWYVVFDGVYPGNIPHELDPPGDVGEL